MRTIRRATKENKQNDDNKQKIERSIQTDDIFDNEIRIKPITKTKENINKS